MRNIWIVVADAGRAEILLKVEGNSGLSVVRQLDNPDGRAHNAELVSDHPGRFEKHGSGVRSAMDPPSDPHEQKARDFAKELNRLLDAAAGRDAYQMLALVAPAHFLGLLRAGMKPAAQRRLILSLNNDLTNFSFLELESRICDALRLADKSNVEAAIS